MLNAPRIYRKGTPRPPLKLAVSFTLFLALLLTFLNADSFGNPEEKIFISLWNTSKTSPGSSNNTSITLPLHEGGAYNFTVDWNGSALRHVSSWNSPNKTYDFGAGSGGVKTISIKGKIEGFGFDNQGDRNKLISIPNWGGLKLGNRGGYFHGAENLVSISKQDPDFEGTYDFSNMFRNASSFRGNVTGWDVSRAANMSGMFRNAGSFSQTIAAWNVCRVSDFENFSSGSGLNASSTPDFSKACALEAGSPNTDGFYKEGDTINLTVSFSRNVSVNGTPVLFLDSGGRASYAGGSGTKTLRFSYAVAEGHYSHDLNYTNSSALIPENGSIHLSSNPLKKALLTLPEGNGSLGGLRNIFVDGVKPALTVRITGQDTKKVSAVDDDPSPTFMSYKIQQSRSCPETVPDDAKNYTEGENIDLDQKNNNMYACFWSVDASGNTGSAASGRISLIRAAEAAIQSSQNPPQVTVSPITGIGVKIVSAADDSSTSTMKYKIQQSSTCQATVPSDAADYAEGSNISLNNESYNGKYACFWSVGTGNQIGSAASAQISGIDSSVFVSIWDTTRTTTGSSDRTSVKLPLEQGGRYDFEVHWGDGNKSRVTAWNDTDAEHSYADEGVKRITVNGTLKGFRFNDGGDRNKLLDITNWGSLRLGNNGSYFYGAENLKNISARDVNLSGTSSLHRMFTKAYNFKGSIGYWDVSNVTSMRFMFASAFRFNQPIGDWDVSKVEDMSFMFDGLAVGTISNHPDARNSDDLHAFDQDISGWDVSRVKNMERMFYSSIFNQPIGGWNTQSLTNLNRIFVLASNFNQDLSQWKVCQIKEALYIVSSYGGNKDFFNRKEFHPQIHAPCVEKVYSPDPNRHYVTGQNITLIAKFEEPVWVKGTHVKRGPNNNDPNYNSKYPFARSELHDPTLELSFKNSKKNATYQGNAECSFQCSKWNAGKCTSDSLYYCTGHSDEVKFVYTVQKDDEAFDLNTTLDALQMKGDIISVNSRDNIPAQDFTQIQFPAVIKLVPLEGSLAGNENITVNHESFVSAWNTSKTSQGSSNSTSIRLPLEQGGSYDFSINWGDNTTSTVTSWNSENATHDYGAGNEGVKELTIVGDINGFRFDSQGDRKKLLNITKWGGLNLGNNGSYFRGATSLTSVPDKANFESTTDFSQMFREAESFNAPIGSWNVSNATNMSKMFSGAKIFNQNISGWNILKTEDMSGMFNNTRDFDQNLSKWEICEVDSYAGFDHNSSNSWDSSEKPKLGGACVIKVSSNNADGAYKINDIISIQLTFDENVTASGNLFLPLNSGGTASYDGGNRTKTLTLSYNVSPGHSADDLNYESVNSLAGGDIKNLGDSKEVLMTLPDLQGPESLGGSKNIIIDGIKPAITARISGTPLSKNVSATDNDPAATVMKYKIQSGSSCSASAPGDASSYTEGSGVVLDSESYNSKYVCFWSADSAGNVGSGISAQISGIDRTAPSITVSSITGTGSKIVSATDNDPAATVMKYKIQSGSSCSASVPIDAKNYTESDNVNLDKETYNSKYVCFWSTDAATNVGNARSDQITGIDKTAPTITITITGTNTKTVKATDNDAGTTIMNYKIQSGSSCSDSVPIDAVSYTENGSVILDRESYNDNYVCFWSKDASNNIGKAISNQITGIDKTPPTITITITGTNTKKISAKDNDPETTTMKYKIQTSNTCTDTIPGDATNYTENQNITLNTENHNNKYICFWSTDNKNNIGKAISNQITGIDKTPPTITITITGTNTKKISAKDNDPETTTMKYKIQTSNTCTDTIPGDATNYTENQNITLNTENHNNKYICFWSTDNKNNIGKAISNQITGIDKTPPTITITITGTNTKKISAKDNDPETTTMKYKIQTSNTCTDTIPGDATNYTENQNITLNTENHNNKYICFWSTDNKNNIGKAISNQITGIDKTPPTITITITGTNTKKISAKDNDPETTTMKYKIQTSNTCTDTIPGDATNYTENQNITLNTENHNNKYICFWSTDNKNNIGKAISNQITGIDKTPPTITITITGTNTKKISAKDNDPETTTMKYKIQTSNTCTDTIPGDATNYTENQNITLNTENHNNKYICFWSTDNKNNIGKAISNQITGIDKTPPTITITITGTNTKKISAKDNDPETTTMKYKIQTSNTCTDTIPGDATNYTENQNITLNTENHNNKYICFWSTDNKNNIGKAISNQITGIDKTPPTITITITGTNTKKISAKDNDPETTTMKYKIQTSNTCTDTIPGDATNYTENQNITLNTENHNNKYICFWSTDNKNNIGKAISNQITGIDKTPPTITITITGTNTKKISAKDNDPETTTMKYKIQTSNTCTDTIPGDATNYTENQNITLNTENHNNKYICFWSTDNKNNIGKAISNQITGIDKTPPTITITITGTNTKKISAKDNDPETTTMKYKIQTSNTCTDTIPGDATNYTENQNITLNTENHNNKYICFWSTDNKNNIGKAISNQITGIDKTPPTITITITGTNTKKISAKDNDPETTTMKYKIQTSNTCTDTIPGDATNYTENQNITLNTENHNNKYICFWSTDNKNNIGKAISNQITGIDKTPPTITITITGTNTKKISAKDNDPETTTMKYKIQTSNTCTDTIPGDATNYTENQNITLNTENHNNKYICFWSTDNKNNIGKAISNQITGIDKTPPTITITITGTNTKKISAKDNDPETTTMKYKIQTSNTCTDTIPGDATNYTENQNITLNTENHNNKYICFWSTDNKNNIGKAISNQITGIDKTPPTITITITGTNTKKISAKDNDPETTTMKYKIQTSNTCTDTIPGDATNYTENQNITLNTENHNNKYICFWSTDNKNNIGKAISNQITGIDKTPPTITITITGTNTKKISAKDNDPETTTMKYKIQTSNTCTDTIPGDATNYTENQNITLNTENHNNKYICFWSTDNKNNIGKAISNQITGIDKTPPTITITITGTNTKKISAKDNDPETTTMKYKIQTSNTCTDTIPGDATNYTENQNITLNTENHNNKYICFWSTDNKNNIGKAISNQITGIDKTPPTITITITGTNTKKISAKDNDPETTTMKYKIQTSNTCTDTIPGDATNYTENQNITLNTENHNNKYICFWSTDNKNNIGKAISNQITGIDKTPPTITITITGTNTKKISAKDNDPETTTMKYKIQTSNTCTDTIPGDATNYTENQNITLNTENHNNKYICFWSTDNKNNIGKAISNQITGIDKTPPTITITITGTNTKKISAKDNDPETTTMKYKIQTSNTCTDTIPGDATNYTENQNITLNTENHNNKYICFWSTDNKNNIGKAISNQITGIDKTPPTITITITGTNTKKISAKDNDPETTTMKYKIQTSNTCTDTIPGDATNYTENQNITLNTENHNNKYICFWSTDNKNNIGKAISNQITGIDKTPPTITITITGTNTKKISAKDNDPETTTMKYKIQTSNTCTDTIPGDATNYTENQNITLNTENHNNKYICFWSTDNKNNIGKAISNQITGIDKTPPTITITITGTNTKKISAKDNDPETTTMKYKIQTSNTCTDTIPGDATNYTENQNITLNTENHNNKYICFWSTDNKNNIGKAISNQITGIDKTPPTITITITGTNTKKISAKDNDPETTTMKYKIQTSNTCTDTIPGDATNYTENQNITLNTENHNNKYICFWSTDNKNNIGKAISNQITGIDKTPPTITITITGTNTKKISAKDNDPETTTMKYKIQTSNTCTDTIPGDATNYTENQNITLNTENHNNKYICFWSTDNKNNIGKAISNQITGIDKTPPTITITITGTNTKKISAKDNDPETTTMKYKIQTSNTCTDTIPGDATNYTENQNITLNTENHNNKYICFWSTDNKNNIGKAISNQITGIDKTPPTITITITGTNTKKISAKDNDPETTTMKYKIQTSNTCTDTIPGDATNYTENQNITLNTENHNNKYICFWSTDNKNNIGKAISNQITGIDKTPPTITITITGTNTKKISAKDNDPETTTMKYKIQTSNTCTDTIPGDATNYTENQNITLNTENHNNKYICFWSTDNKNNIGKAISNQITGIDKTPPTITITITGTNTKKISAKDNDPETTTMKYKIQTSNTCTDTIPGDATNYTENQNITLNTENHNNKYICFWSTDNKNNIGKAISNQITGIDKTPPTITITITGTNTKKISAKDNDPETTTMKYKIQTSNTCTDTIPGDATNYTENQNITLNTENHNNKYICFWSTDNKNNIGKAISNQITGIDKTPPTITITITGTNTKKISAKDNDPETTTMKYKIQTSNTCTDTIPGDATNYTENQNITLNTENHNNKYICFWSTDNKNNIGKAISNQITGIDKTPPTITITITGTNTKKISAKDNDPETTTMKYKIQTSNTCTDTIPGDATNYTENQNITLNTENHNNKYICFWSTDNKNNIGKAISNQITGIDKTPPTITITITGTNTKKISAKDNDPETTTMKYKIQTSNTCTDTIPGDATNYTENQNITLNTENHNNKYICFWSTDNKNNIGKAISNQITGIDKTPPTITITITGTNTKKISAKDNDPETTTMKYKIQTSNTCTDTIPGDATNYTENQNITLNTENHNNKYICFWSTDNKNNIGKAISNQITGIDKTPPTITITITGTNTKKISAKDNDPETTTMKYKIQTSNTCTDTIPGDATNYTENQNITLNTENHNNKYICFWSTDNKNNIGKAISNQITGIDKTPPTITITITGTNTKKISAKDNDPETTTMKYKIQSGNSCSDSIPNDAVNYTEGSNLSLDSESYNNKYVCFWSADENNNVGKRVSGRISGIDLTAPKVNVSPITGTGAKKVSATDDDPGTTTMKYKIQSSSTCPAAVPNGAAGYAEGTNLTLNKESYNGKHVCFWSTDQSSNVGRNVSARISGIDITAPAITVSQITGTGTKKVSATDDDPGTTKMKYRIQAGSSCSNSIPGGAKNYTEGHNISLDNESYNGKHVCFWSTDQSSNTGRKASSRISGIDLTAPKITVSPITGSGAKEVSARDDDPAPTVMEYKIQTSSACTDTIPQDATNYKEAGRIVLDNESYNGKHVCFWSTDESGNTGSSASARIAGIDTSRPRVLNVTSSNSDGVYRKGAAIQVSVGFSEAVTVNGPLYLELDAGPNAVAAYQNGSGSRTLNFTYKVSEGDSTPDLNYRSTGSLVLNGGSIKDANMNDAFIALPHPSSSMSLGGMKNIRIDAAKSEPAPASQTGFPQRFLVYKDFPKDVSIEKIAISLHEFNRADLKADLLVPEEIEGYDVFETVSITLSNYNSTFEAFIIFNVRKSWLGVNNATIEDVKLMRFDSASGRWKELETEASLETETEIQFTARTSEFSKFAIASRQAGYFEMINSKSGTAAPPEEQASHTPKNETPGPDMSGNTRPPNKEYDRHPEDPRQKQVYDLFISGIILVLLIGFMIVMRSIPEDSGKGYISLKTLRENARKQKRSPKKKRGNSLKKTPRNS